MPPNGPLSCLHQGSPVSRQSLEHFPALHLVHNNKKSTLIPPPPLSHHFPSISSQPANTKEPKRTTCSPYLHREPHAIGQRSFSPLHCLNPLRTLELVFSWCPGTAYMFLSHLSWVWEKSRCWWNTESLSPSLAKLENHYITTEEEKEKRDNNLERVNGSIKKGEINTSGSRI